MQKLIKQLHALRKCETFDNFSAPAAFVIEYFYKGNYSLLITSDPTYWCKRYRNCPRNSGFKVMEWLKQY